MPGLRPGAPAGQPQQLIVDPSFPAGQPPLCLMTLQVPLRWDIPTPLVTYWQLRTYKLLRDATALQVSWVCNMCPNLCALQWLRRVFELIDHKHLSPGRFPLAVLSTLAAKLSSGNPELATGALLCQSWSGCIQGSHHGMHASTLCILVILDV